jgi:hypothetical protein
MLVVDTCMVKLNLLFLTISKKACIHEHAELKPA